MNGYLVKSTIRHDGQRYKKGDFIPESTLDEQSSKRLLFLNVVAKAYQESEETIEAVPPENTGGGSQGNEEETIEEILEANFELDELKSGAKEVGLTFAANLGMPNLIKLIVENEKQDFFLDQLVD